MTSDPRKFASDLNALSEEHDLRLDPDWDLHEVGQIGLLDGNGEIVGTLIWEPEEGRWQARAIDLTS